jgi:hypothetical protein
MWVARSTLASTLGDGNFTELVCEVENAMGAAAARASPEETRDHHLLIFLNRPPANWVMTFAL